MTRTKWAIGGILIGLIGSALPGRDRDASEPSRGFDGSIGGAVDVLSQGVKNTTENLGEGWSRARSTVGNVGLVQQIGTRLHQDKNLDARHIMISVRDETTAVLEGLVPDHEAKEKAVELTRDTRGVLQVIDNLAVVPEPRIISAEPKPGEVADGGDEENGVAVIEIPRRRR